MMGIRSRVVGALAAGAACAVVAAVAAPAAQAGATGSAHPRNAVVVQYAAGQKGGKPAQDPVLAGAAKRFGLSVDRLERALVGVKEYIASSGREPKSGLLDPGVLRVFARGLGVPVARAQAVARYLQAAWEANDKGGKGKGKPAEGALPPEAVAFFAKTLHVSKARAAAALKQLFAIAKGPKGSIDPRSAAFAKIARGLGVTPKQLNAALVALKKFIATQEPGKPAPGKPVPGKPAPGKPAPGKPDPGKPGTPKPATAA